MTLFPNLSDSYYVENDHGILKFMDTIYSKNITINQTFWSEASLDSRFHAGDQTLWNDIYGNLPAFRKRQFNFNRIRRVVNMISGYQRQHRKSTVVSPIESSDEQTSDQFSKIMFHINGYGGVLNTISDAFQGAVITGMNLLSTWIDYRDDPVNGDIRVDNLSYNSYLIDPFFKKADLSDCNNLWTRKYLSRQQVMGLLPGRESEIENLRGSGNRDGKFQFMPESYNYAIQDLLIYDELWYLDSRRQKMLLDTQTGDTIEWKGNDENLEEFLRQYNEITVIESTIPTVKLAIIVQGKVMYNGPNPLGIDSYPFVPVWGYYQPEIADFPWRIQGVVRGLRDSQYLYNRRKIIELDILESQINSGYIYKESALVNPKDVFLQGQGRGLALKAEANITDVVPIQAPQVPPSMIQLSELLGREISEISGVNEELLGAADDDKAGILAQLRQGAGLTTLQVLFDNVDQAQKILGGLHIKLVQNNWTPGKVKRIINQEPSQQFYNRLFGKYDAVVEDGLNTSTQKQMQFVQLVKLKELGLPIPTEIMLEAATVQNKKELIDAITKQEQQASQMQQQQQQVQMQVLQAQIEDLKAKAMANEGLGVERASRIQENRALAVERLAEAEKDRDLGVLDRVKAVKELASIDLSQLQQSLEILERLKNYSKQESVEETEEQIGPVREEKIEENTSQKM